MTQVCGMHIYSTKWRRFGRVGKHIFFNVLWRRLQQHWFVWHSYGDSGPKHHHHHHPYHKTCAKQHEPFFWDEGDWNLPPPRLRVGGWATAHLLPRRYRRPPLPPPCHWSTEVDREDEREEREGSREAKRKIVDKSGGCCCWWLFFSFFLHLLFVARYTKTKTANKLISFLEVKEASRKFIDKWKGV